MVMKNDIPETRLIIELILKMNLIYENCKYFLQIPPSIHRKTLELSNKYKNLLNNST